MVNRGVVVRVMSRCSSAHVAEKKKSAPVSMARECMCIVLYGEYFCVVCVTRNS